MIDQEALINQVHGGLEVWVKLYNGLIISPTAYLGGDLFEAKFTPCAKNARTHKIKFGDIKEYYQR